MQGRTIKYTVNDTECYGITNGFSQYDEDVQAILSEAYGPYAWEARERVGQLTYTEAVKAACMPYYRPYPVHEDWSEEVKARVRRLIEERKASGVCNVPYDLARMLILSSLRAHMEAHIGQEMAEMERDLARMQVQKENGCFSATREEAREREYRYNEMNNQGGYGYVPRFYSAEDEQWILERLSKSKAIIERISAEAEI